LALYDTSVGSVDPHQLTKIGSRTYVANRIQSTKKIIEPYCSTKLGGVAALSVFDGMTAFYGIGLFIPARGPQVIVVAVIS
jgi:hypothetical protein